MSNHENDVDGPGESSGAKKTQPDEAHPIQTEEQMWLKWIRKYKDAIEIASFIVGVTVALASLWYMQAQLDQLVANDEVASEQTSLLSEQVQAMWYGNRPILRISAFDARKDVIRYSEPWIVGIIDTLPRADTIHDVSKLYSLHYKIENVGPSPAIIDTIYTYVTYTANDIIGCDDLTLEESNPWGDLEMSPRDIQVFQTDLPLIAGPVNWVKLVVIYRWDGPTGVNSRLVVKKCLRALQEDSDWHIYNVSCSVIPETTHEHKSDTGLSSN